MSGLSCKLFPWGGWISLYCVLSFAVLGLDAGLNHRFAFQENAFTYIPVVFAPVAVVACAICASSLGWRRAAWFIGALALLVGAVGTFFHILPAFGAIRHGMPIFQAILGTGRPIFAPAAFASTGLLMLLVSWGTRREQSEIGTSYAHKGLTRVD